MKILNSWLNDFGAFGTDKEKLSAAMTNLGLAVESVEPVGTPVDGGARAGPASLGQCRRCAGGLCRAGC